MHVDVYILELNSNIEFILSFSFWGLWGDMGDSDNKKNKTKMSRSEMESFSLDSSRFSRDFLTRFMGSGSREAELELKKEENDEEEEEIELNLGLSLGGRFGVDKSSKKLMRSSSIAACLPTVRDDDALATSSPPVAYSSLVRTSSLPVETEEEWRKRKELQTLRRMAAKRRRSEKQRNLKAEKLEASSIGEDQEKKEIESNLRGKLEREQYLAAAKRFSSSVGPPFGVSTWGAAARQAILGGGIDVSTMAKGKGSFVVGKLGQLLSQGSVESQGGTSSSELENKPLQGTALLGHHIISLEMFNF